MNTICTTCASPAGVADARGGRGSRGPVAHDRLNSEEGQKQATDHWMSLGVAKAKAKMPKRG